MTLKVLPPVELAVIEHWPEGALPEQTVAPSNDTVKLPEGDPPPGALTLAPYEIETCCPTVTGLGLAEMEDVVSALLTVTCEVVELPPAMEAVMVEEPTDCP